MKAHNLKVLAMRALFKFVKKAKAIKGDPIQERLIDSEAVEMDENGDFVVVNHSSSIDFIPVNALQISTLTMSAPTEITYGNAVNCKQTLSTSVKL